jgi:hypothetical protein
VLDACGEQLRALAARDLVRPATQRSTPFDDKRPVRARVDEVGVTLAVFGIAARPRRAILLAMK